MTYQFPTDLRFRTLAAKLADAVQVAIWRGWKIRPLSSFEDYQYGREDCKMYCCPLGTVSDVAYPPSGFRCLLHIKTDEFQAFLHGFERPRGDACPPAIPRPWFELGRAYRERFGD